MQSQPQHRRIVEVHQGLPALKRGVARLIEALRHPLAGLCRRVPDFRDNFADDLNRPDHALHNRIRAIAKQWHDELKRILRRQRLKRELVGVPRRLVISISRR